jgi:hypothetical protein
VYRKRPISGKKGERGVVILVVAIVLLFVVGAMAVLAIDFVSYYTARSEAQLAADSAALAGARVLANSGATSNPSDSGLRDNAKALAQAVATQVAMSNRVGGRNLNVAEVNVSFTGSSAGGGGGLGSNPRIAVRVTRSDLPTFFARIWGQTQLTLSAAATAEAYNPSGLNIAPGDAPPVAPICVKPWVLPNISPADGTSQIFNTATGAIQDTSLIGWTDNDDPPTFYSRCTGTGGTTYSCDPWNDGQVGAMAWRYYPGQQSSFAEPPPTQTLQSCSAGFQPYQRSIAGCVATPIACNGTVQLDQTDYPLRNTEAADAVNCMTHSEKNKGDIVALKPPNQAFQFQAGSDNPIAGAGSKNFLVSDSLVTVPVYLSTNGAAPPVTVQIIGFVQLFLNPDGLAAGAGTPPRIRTTIVNLVGCGTNATSTPPIIGNGASPVAVRLVSSGS